MPTTYVSRSQLQASVPPGDVQANGSAVVTVRNAGSLNAPSNGLAEYSTFPTSLPSFSTLGLTATGQPTSVVTADLNGDGFPDIVVANRGDYPDEGPTHPTPSYVCLNDGKGHFAACEALPTESATSIVAADLDGASPRDSRCLRQAITWARVMVRRSVG